MGPDIECTPNGPTVPPSGIGTGGTCTGATMLLPSGGLSYTAWDASDDASLIVGSGTGGAFVWDRYHGFRLVADVLREQGVVLDQWSLISATSVSADGLVVVGYGRNPNGDYEAWRADLSPTSRPAVGSGEQLRPLPQAGLDQISVSFSENVVVAQDNLGISAINAEYPVTSFAYDSATHTATWRLAAPIESNALEITVASGANGVRDLAGLSLEGEWDNPTGGNDPQSDTYPSGDGTAGGDFKFRMDVIAGDVTGNGEVDRSDVIAIVLHAFAASGQARYDLRYDIDANGVINAADVLAARNRQGPIPPSASPNAEDSPATDSTSVSRRLTARRVDAAISSLDDVAGSSHQAESLTTARRLARDRRR